MSVDTSPEVLEQQNGPNGTRVLQKSPSIPAENGVFATNMGPQDGVFVAKIASPPPDATCEQRLTAMIATVDAGGLAEVLAVAVTRQRVDYRGRPEALDVEGRRKVCLLLKLGYSRSLAAAELGVHRSTITRTMSRVAEFKVEVLEAEELASRTPLVTILEAARRNWRAAAWLMKHNVAESVKQRKMRASNRAANRRVEEMLRDSRELQKKSQRREMEPPLYPPRKARQTTVVKKSG